MLHRSLAATVGPDGLTNAYHHIRQRRMTRGAMRALVAAILGVACLSNSNHARAELDNCADPLPKPGPARAWEAGVAVSPYCEANTRHRNLFTAIPIVHWGGTGPDMGMALYHNAATVAYASGWTSNAGFDLGPGWTVAYSDQLILTGLPNTITAVAASGTENVFTWNATTSTWGPPAGVHDVLTFDSELSYYRLRHKDQSIHDFAVWGTPPYNKARLVRIVDAVGNATGISYSSNRISSITAAGRPLNFTYCNGGGPPSDCPDTGKLWKITDPGNDSGCVPLETCMDDRFWEFQYTSGRLSKVYLPEVDPPSGPPVRYYFEFTHNTAGRISALRDVDGNSYSFAYFTDGGISTVTEPNTSDPDDGRSVTFNTVCGNHAYRTDHVDRYGYQWSYSYNTDLSYDLYPDGNLNMLLKPGPGTVLNKDMLWDTDRNLIQFVDEVGAGFNAGFDDHGNRTYREDGLSRVQEWEYDEFNNLTAYIDADLNRTELEYAFAADPVGGACSASSPDAGASCVVCLGGANDGDGCFYDSDCPGGTCGRDNAICRLCASGAEIGQSCTLSADCTGNGSSFCVGGSNHGLSCTVPANCPGGLCVVVACGGTCDAAPPPPPPFPTLLTKITEPAISVPGGQTLPAAQTTLEYYLDGSGPMGQVKKVTDPNGVVTTFDYDQWGQLEVYAEGEYGGFGVYCEQTEFDVGGRLRTSMPGCPLAGRQPAGNGSGGTMNYNALNNAESSSCGIAVLFRDPTTPFKPAGFPVLPGSRPTPPIPYTEFENADYTAYGAATNLPTDVFAFQHDQTSEPRVHHTEYDALRRVKEHEVATDEATLTSTITRTFLYDYEVVSNKLRTTRTGPDAIDTVVNYDESGRAVSYRRGPARDNLAQPPVIPLLEATYEYYDNDLVHRVFHGDPGAPTAVTEYTYDVDNEVETIVHKRLSGDITLLKLVYEWDPRGMPEEIREYKNASVLVATVTFTYDQRGRLVKEVRDDTNNAKDYNLRYEYDQGGNRTAKIDTTYNRRYSYFYDNATPAMYESKNNRLEYIETSDNTTFALLSTTWYYYSDSGNVRYIVSGASAGGSSLVAGGGGDEESLSSGEGPVEEGLEGIEPESQGGGSVMAMGGGTCSLELQCPTGSTGYAATRFEYAKNNQTLAYAIGEEWCWDADPAHAITNARMTFAREFRYDSGRARYLSRALTFTASNPSVSCYVGTFSAGTATWTDYDGDSAYGDWTVSGSATNVRSFEPGIGRIDPWVSTGSANSAYYRTDMLGTTRLMTKANGDPVAGWGTAATPNPAVFTAFGDRIGTSGPLNGNGSRYGYVGAHGYQAHDEMAFLHVGARYYEPSNGRFLQRDSIGLRGGRGVYSYVGSRPTAQVDPTGFQAAWPSPAPLTPIPPPGSPGVTPFGTMGAYATLCATAWFIGDYIGDFLVDNTDIEDVVAEIIIPPDPPKKPNKIYSPRFPQGINVGEW